MKNQTGRKILCECLGVTERTVAACVKSGRACTVNEVMACTEAGTGCTACHKAIQRVVEQHAPAAAAPLTQKAS
jgi:NifU-like protein